MVPLTSMHDYWKNHSFNYTDLCQQCLCFLFLIHCLDCQRFSSKEQVSFNFMAAVTICSDFGAQENKVCHYFHSLPIYLSWSDGTGCHGPSFWMSSFKPAFSLSSFTFIKRLFSYSSSIIRLVSSAFLRLLIFLRAILIPPCDSPGLAFCMMYSA